jgi:exo-beta-1,3-glucanase (GH17 family)
VSIVDAPVGRVSCVSYAPSSEAGDSLLDEKWIVTPEHIEQDLKLLAQRFDCVRTYSQGNGLDQVPRIAHRLGMKTIMGIWLSRDEVSNEREIAIGIRTALRDREAIRAIVVGNEVLLRGELTATALERHIEQVRAATGLPVTYADVWEFWRRHHAAIAPAVSFMTIHILPYWEDEPVTIDDAVDHVRRIYEDMHTRFPDKPILIGETGWPSAGRQRRGAIPSLVNQARFMREFLVFTETAGIAYNVIEAFDQPWKRNLEGTVGGYWGQYDRSRAVKFPLQGGVVEFPHGIRTLGIAAALALIVSVLSFVTGWRASFAAWAVFTVSVYATFLSVAVSVQQWLVGSRSTVEWTVGGLCIVVATYCAMLLARVLADAVAGRGIALIQPLQSIQWRSMFSVSSQLGWLRALWLFAAAVWCLLLMYDARYRDFPSWLLGPLIVGFALMAGSSTSALRSGIDERFMAVVIAASSIVILVNEQLSNTSAVIWVALCLLFSACVWRSSIRRSA